MEEAGWCELRTKVYGKRALMSGVILSLPNPCLQQAGVFSEAASETSSVGRGIKVTKYFLVARNVAAPVTVPFGLAAAAGFSLPSGLAPGRGEDSG